MKIIIRYCKFIFNVSKKYFFLNMLFIIIVSFSWIAVNYSLKILTEIITIQQNGKINIIVLCIPIALYFIFAILLGGDFNNLEKIITIKFVSNSMKKLVNEFFELESEIKHDLFYDHDFNNGFSFAKNGQNKIVEVVTLLMNRGLISLFNIIIPAITIMHFQSTVLISLSLVSIILYFLNAQVSEKKFNMEKSIIEKDRIDQYLTDLLTNKESAKEIRLFRFDNFIFKKWYFNYRYIINKRFNLELKGTLYSFLIRLCEMIMNYTFIIYLFYLVLNDYIMPGDAVFLQGTFWVLSYGISTFITLLSRDIEESKKYILEYDRFICKYKGKKDGNRRSYNCEQPLVSLELKNVSYKYPGQTEYALKNINLKIKAGEIVCLIGENGSGKSTLSKIICGLLEDYTGEVLINNKNIKTLNKEEIYSIFGIAFQDINKYAISLEENIMIGNLDKFNNGKYEKVIKDANLSEIIHNLPKGDKTILGKEYDEFGQDISLGQWQRVILARAYIKNPKLLILDEPTSSIDPQEEMRCVSSFNMKNMNIDAALLITHRIGFAKISNQIYMMKKGEIVEEGSHDDLLLNKGDYCKIYHEQKYLYK